MTIGDEILVWLLRHQIFTNGRSLPTDSLLHYWFLRPSWERPSSTPLCVTQQWLQPDDLFHCMDLLASDSTANHCYVFLLHLDSVPLPIFETPKVSSGLQLSVSHNHAKGFPLHWFQEDVSCYSQWSRSQKVVQSPQLSKLAHLAAPPVCKFCQFYESWHTFVIHATTY